MHVGSCTIRAFLSRHIRAMLRINGVWWPPCQSWLNLAQTEPTHRLIIPRSLRHHLAPRYSIHPRHTAHLYRSVSHCFAPYSGYRGRAATRVSLNILTSLVGYEPWDRKWSWNWAGMMIEAYISFVWHGRGTNDTYTCEFQTLRVERVVDGGSFLFIVYQDT